MIFRFNCEHNGRRFHGGLFLINGTPYEWDALVKKSKQMKIIFMQGEKCSANFVFKNKVESMNQLMNILENQPSLFWNHRVYPSAVIIQQKLIVLVNSIKYGHIWEIDKIQGGNK